MYDVRYSCISCIYMADLTSLFLFYFIFELLRIFAVMINTAKLELINAAENCLLKFFLVRTFFNSIQKLLIFFLIILCLSHSHLVKIKWFKYNLNKMLYNVLSNEWELKIVNQQNCPVGKKIGTSFSANVFSWSFINV